MMLKKLNLLGFLLVFCAINSLVAMQLQQKQVKEQQKQEAQKQDIVVIAMQQITKQTLEEHLKSESKKISVNSSCSDCSDCSDCCWCDDDSCSEDGCWCEDDSCSEDDFWMQDDEICPICYERNCTKFIK